MSAPFAPLLSGLPVLTPDGSLAFFRTVGPPAGLGAIAMVDLMANKVVRTFTLDELKALGAVTVQAHLAISADGSTVYAIATGATPTGANLAPTVIIMIDVATRTLSSVSTPAPHGEGAFANATGVAVGPDGAHVYLRGQIIFNFRWGILVLNRQDGSMATSVAATADLPVKRFVQTPDRERFGVITLAGLGMIMARDLAPGATFALVGPPSATGRPAFGLALSNHHAFALRGTAAAASVSKVAFDHPDAYDPIELALPPGSAPAGIAVTSGGHWVFVDDGQAGTVSLIDGATLTVVRVIPVGADPTGMAISRDDRVLCVRVSEGTGVVVLRVPPVVTGLGAAQISADGGPVTISGSGLDGVVEVLFGDTPATHVSASPVAVGTALLAQAPPRAAGRVAVSVRTSAGTSPADPGAVIEYVPNPVITALQPPSGKGGMSVRIVGQHLGIVTSVVFGTTTPTAFTLESDGSLTVIAPTRGPGAATVQVRTPLGASNGVDFDYLPPPHVSELVPAAGPISGRPVEVRGTGLATATSVTVAFSASVTTTITDVGTPSDTALHVTLPPGRVGPATVVVHSEFGDSAGMPFTYVPAPAVTSLEPSACPLGGTHLEIHGAALAAATAVLVDGVAVTAFDQVSDTLLTVVAPRHAAGSVDVVVRSPGGDSAAAKLAYVPMPLITKLDPPAVVLGGQPVTITGSGLAAVTAVLVDRQPVALSGAATDTALRFVAPSHGVGTVDVVARSAGGDSPAARLAYVPLPVITKLDPPTVSVQGTTVTVTGSGLAAVTAVLVDGVPLPTLGAATVTSLKFAAPPHAAGTVDVTVRSPGGDSAAAPLTYVPVPVIRKLDPPTVSVRGRTVTATGSGLAAVTAVLVDGHAVAVSGVGTETTLTFAAPSHAAGTVDVVARSAGGDSVAARLAYLPLPAITKLDPPTVPVQGSPVTVTGTGLAAATAVLVDGHSVAVSGAATDTSVTFAAPGHVAGRVDVVVRSPVGDSPAAPLNYAAAPVITTLAPAAVPLRGQVVTITGSGFAGASVDIDGMPAALVGTASDTTVQFAAPEHAAGPVPVMVRGPGGDSASRTLTYLPPPTVTRLNPVAGPVGGGAALEIHGSAVRNATAVSFGAAVVDLVPPADPVVDFPVPADQGSIDAGPVDAVLSVTVPAGPAGPVAVVVHTPGGDSEGRPFTYVPPPSLTSLSPSSTAEGQTVNLTGRNLGPVTSVIFGAIVITALEHSGLGTSIDVRVPPGTGAVDVTAVSVGGISNKLAFTYV